jgi:hypothetical protein
MIYWSYESGREDYVDEGLGASAKRILGRDHAFLHEKRGGSGSSIRSTEKRIAKMPKLPELP